MSIGYRKITEMLEAEIASNSNIIDNHKSDILRLCTKIYMLESSTDVSSKQRLIEEVRNAIAQEADNLSVDKS